LSAFTRRDVHRRSLGRALFGLTPTDSSIFITAGVILAVTALLAGWLPARRAALVDPLVALRQD
jgi:ABC-type antimicrobial peptide transport system permease subunit